MNLCAPPVPTSAPRKAAEASKTRALSEALRAKVEQLRPLFLLLLVGELVLGLRDGEFAVAFELDVADPEICAACASDRLRSQPSVAQGL